MTDALPSFGPAAEYKHRACPGCGSTLADYRKRFVCGTIAFNDPRLLTEDDRTPACYELERVLPIVDAACELEDRGTLIDAPYSGKLLAAIAKYRSSK